MSGTFPRRSSVVYIKHVTLETNSGDRLLGNISLDVEASDHLAVIGPNGACWPAGSGCSCWMLLT